MLTPATPRRGDAGGRAPPGRRLRCLAACLLVAGCAADTRPLELIGGADLVYPPFARAAGVEGLVIVRYDVTAEGRVENAEVVAAEPPGVFEDAALTTVRSWRFRPPVAAGRITAVRGRVSEVAFRTGTGDYDHLPAPAAASTP